MCVGHLVRLVLLSFKIKKQRHVILHLKTKVSMIIFAFSETSSSFFQNKEAKTCYIAFEDQSIDDYFCFLV